MNARLGFSIAVHLNPDVLIIDEVLSVGDMTFQQKCFDRMLEFKRDGVAIVLVSHNLQAVGSLCDNVLYLAGSVKAFGPASQVLEQYVRSSQPEPHSKIASTVRVGSVSFDDEGEGAYREVAAGALLRLRLRIESQEHLDDVTFAFVIHRSTDSLVVYNGHVHRRELGPVSEFGREFVLDFAFRANLTRGIYHLSLQVIHNPTLQFLIRSQQLATLAVRESRSREGVADVELSASLGSISAVSHRA
jgi:ABC-type glutathione transport system ATPase component